MHIYYVHETDKQLKKFEKKCPHCEKLFHSRKNFEEHVISKHEKRTPFKCNECHRSYATNTVLKWVHHKAIFIRIFSFSSLLSPA